jgi:hypothetical protein
MQPEGYIADFQETKHAPFTTTLVTEALQDTHDAARRAANRCSRWAEKSICTQARALKLMT